MRPTTPKRASGNERALKKGGAGGHPPRLFASGLSLEKAWIPARDRAGNHVAGSTLRRSQRDHLPMTEGPGPLSPHFSGEMGTPAGQAGPRGAAPRGREKPRPPVGYALSEAPRALGPTWRAYGLWSKPGSPPGTGREPTSQVRTCGGPEQNHLPKAAPASPGETLRPHVEGHIHFPERRKSVSSWKPNTS